MKQHSEHLEPLGETPSGTGETPVLPRIRVGALWAAFFLSGVAGLGYQVVWSKMFAAGLGHEFSAVVAVVAAFFAGMALGGFWSPLLLRSPVGGFAVPMLELVIGLWGGLTPAFISWADGYFTANYWFNSAFVFLMLLPCTAAMGATLPAMARLAKQAGSTQGIRTAYATNTFGAVLGCLATAFVLMPRFEFTSVCRILAAINFAAAMLSAWICLETTAIKETPAKSLSKELAFIFGATGFLALGFETLGVRLLSQSLENTVYSFAVILAVYLLGQAAGAAVFRRYRLSQAALFAGLSVALAISVPIFGCSADFYEWLRARWGDSLLAVALAELTVSLSVYGLPTLLMGALFVDLAEKAQNLGHAICWNSMGAAMGAIIMPAIISPMAGLATAISLLAIVYALFIRRWFAILVILALIPTFFVSTKKTLARVPPGQRVLDFRAGRLANVLVTEAPDGNRTLFVNNRFQMGGTSARIAELRHGHIPLLLARDPKRALFLGLGTGISLSAADAYPNLTADGVELLPEVLMVMPAFFEPPERSPLVSKKIRIHTMDARTFVRQTANVYDVIVGDLFHPAQDGAGFLYTREHFGNIKTLLSKDGLFCQWLPVHQLSVETFRNITRTFIDVFPVAQAWMLRFNIDAPVVGLIGWSSPGPLWGSAETRTVDETLSEQLRRVGLSDSTRLFGCYLAGSDQLADFASSGQYNSDSFPVVTYEAPLFSFHRRNPSYSSFVKLLEYFPHTFTVDRERPFHPRLVNFLAARNHYIRALILEAEGQSVAALDGYIESARISEDFTAGYAQCILIATAKGKSDPAGARRILERLVEAQPGRPVAREMLERMGK